MKKHKDFTIGRMVNGSYQKGDLVRINFDMEQDSDDGEYGFSIENGEIGEVIRQINSNETRETEKVYSIKFPVKNGKKRIYWTLLNEPLYSKVRNF